MVALLVITSAVPSKKNKKLLYDCSFIHLRDNSLLEHVKHMSYVAGIVEEEMCSALLVAFSEEVYDSLLPLIQADQRFTAHSDCIIEKLRSFAVDDSYLAKHVYSEDKTMSKLRRMRILSDLSATIEQKFELAEELCAPVQMFGKF